MGKTVEKIGDRLREWIAAQRIFFVSTAPLSEAGMVNCSPKGTDSLRVLDAHTVAYLDLTGSGVETIAHLRENGRILIMLCAFDGPPKIVRLHGRGEVLEPGSLGFETLRAIFPETPGARAIIRVDVSRISESCGFAVPLYDHVGDRDALTRWAAQKGEAGVAEYRRQKNQQSIDGLPGLDG